MSKPSSISSSKDQTALLDPPDTAPRRRRAAYAQRGRRAIAWGAVLFVLACLVGQVLIDLCPLPFRFPEAAAVLAHAPRGDQSPQVVLFGSSRFGIGVNTDLFTDALRRYSHNPALSGYNAAIPAGDPITADFVLQQLLKEGCRPHIAVIEISPETVNRFVPWMKFHILRQLSRWETIRTIPDSMRSKAFDRVMTSLFFPLFRHNVQLTGWGSYTVSRLMGEGKEPILERVFPDPKQTMGKSEETDYYKWFKTYQISGVLPEKLNHLLTLCRENNIQPVLIGIPVSSHHRRFYTPEVEARYLQYMRQMEHEYGCAFIDLAGVFADDCFADHHHLNSKGNPLFSDLLAKEVVRVLHLDQPAPKSQDQGSSGR